MRVNLSNLLDEISKFEIIYLREYEDQSNDLNSHLDYIQKSKFKKLRTISQEDEERFEANSTKSANLLADQVGKLGIEFDVIFSPNSSRSILMPFKMELSRRCSAKDISNRFHRIDENIKAADPNVPTVKIAENIEFRQENDESSFENILMVDDCISRNLTAAAHLSHLIKAGAVRENITFVVAAPLFVPNAKSRGKTLEDAIREVIEGNSESPVSAASPDEGR